MPKQPPENYSRATEPHPLTRAFPCEEAICFATLLEFPSRTIRRFARGKALERAEELHQVLFLRRRQFGSDD